MTAAADPFAAVAALPGVGLAAAQARDAVDALLRHPAMRRSSGRIAAASAVAGARASVALASDGDVLLAGALRVYAQVPSLARAWDRAPAQVLARVHLLLARDVVAAETLGRPRPDSDPGRLAQLLRLATGPTAAPGVVVAALVHAELAVLEPFGRVDAVLARALERVVLVARGVDTKAVSVPEAGHLTLVAGGRSALAAYTIGEPTGVAAWVGHCAQAYSAGAEAGLALCAEVQ